MKTAIKLTTKGQELLSQINEQLEKDRLCWYWVMYCSGDGNSCQRVCGGIGSCLNGCENYGFTNNLKNGNDMHLCQVRVISECRLSWLNSDFPLRIVIQGCHKPLSHQINSDDTKISRINLTYSIRDMIAVSRRADHRTAKGIKSKLLAPFNNAPEEIIRKALNSQREICDNNKLRKFVARDDKKFSDNTGPWTQLHNLIINNLKPRGFVLFYQTPDLTKPLNSFKRYYQLTVSDDYWLLNGRDFGKVCIGIDGKYDLNSDHAPILTILVENNAGHGTPVAFGKFVLINIFFFIFLILF